MAELTRRGFITKTSVGAAALGTLAAAPGLITPAQAAPQAPMGALSEAAVHQSLMAHVRNVATGEIALLVGTREVVIRDRELVMRLVKAAQ